MIDYSPCQEACEEFGKYTDCVVTGLYSMPDGKAYRFQKVVAYMGGFDFLFVHSIPDGADNIIILAARVIDDIPI